MRSPEAAKVLDVDNAVGDVLSPVDALVSEEVFECEDDATMDEQESENGRQRKAGRGGSAVYDLEYIVDMNAECKPYPQISDKVVLDEEYKCEEPEIVRTAQSLVNSKWPEMHSVFSKCIVWCMK
jgi:endo-alpha-1,4-polygalactosaminidase (GH114 family)